MNRIKRVSLFFRIVFQLLFIIFPVVIGIGWATNPDSIAILGGVINMNIIPQAYIHSILHTLTPAERILGFTINLIPLIVDLMVLYFLIKLFRLYEKGEIFSMKNVNYIRNIGYTLLIGQLLNPIYEGLMGVVLTMNNPKGHRFASISFDQANIGILFMAFLVILISWIMAEGCKLREEQQLTV